MRRRVYVHVDLGRSIWEGVATGRKGRRLRGRVSLHPCIVCRCSSLVAEYVNLSEYGQGCGREERGEEERNERMKGV